MKRVLFAMGILAFAMAAAVVVFNQFHGADGTSDEPFAVEYQRTGSFVAARPFDGDVSAEGYTGTIRRIQNGCIGVVVEGETPFVAVWPEGTTVVGHGANLIIRVNTVAGRFDLKLGERIIYGQTDRVMHLSRWVAEDQRGNCRKLPAKLLDAPGPIPNS